jgi:ribonucleoside-diphosphate reductase alpha chain
MKGLTIKRHYTTPEIPWQKSATLVHRTSEIKNPDGSVVWRMDSVEVPETWSQTATDILASKYCRKAGVPQPDGSLGAETSIVQVVGRIVRAIRAAGEEQGGYFATPEDAEVFEQELAYMLMHQIGAFNSPVWFNVGLHLYGIRGQGGHWVWSDMSGRVRQIDDGYERPQGSACMPYGVLVNTNEGLIPIGEIVERLTLDPFTMLYTYDKDGLPTRIVRGICNGKRGVIDFALADGTTLSMTSNHVVFVEGDDGELVEKPAGDLVVGKDRLVLSRAPLVAPDRSVWLNGIRVTPDMAWLAGVMVGNGFSGRPPSLTSDTWEVKVNTEAERNRVESTLARHGVSFTAHPFHWGFAIRGYGAGGRRFWERLGLWEKTGAKVVPEWVFRSGQDLVGAFLSGLFGTDGTVNQASNGRVKIQLANTSRQVIESTSSLLRSLGIFSAITSYEDDRPEHTRKEGYCVNVSDVRSVDLFAERVGFIHEGKRSELNARAPNREAAYRRDSVLVESKSRSGVMQVYDIQTEAGVFWADGRLVHNCYIATVEDSLEALYKALTTETMLFRYGSGVGSNFSKVRGKQEKLSSGGTSSGVMSFLNVFDRAAGAIKSGGTTRRAAKLVCLDMDHPEIEDFITWKMREEKKAKALIAAGYPSDFNGEAYATVSGQNSNNSVQVTDAFMRAVEEDGDWCTTERTTGKVVKTYKARDLWNLVAEAAWHCADPGVQFTTTMNRWCTHPSRGPIVASNPCGEFLCCNDSSCNLCCLNLTKFLRADGSIDLEAYEHAIRVFFLAQEILVDFVSYPTKEIAQNSHDLRPLGLGYTNLGSLLMQSGYAYDSEGGRALAAAMTSLLTARAYLTSVEMAQSKGPFPGFEADREAVLRVLDQHGAASVMLGCNNPVLDPLFHDQRSRWLDVMAGAERHGVRNCYASLAMPAGTVGLLMDSDTTGIEPDFALVKFKKLAGGGTMVLANQAIAPALEHLGYGDEAIEAIVTYVEGTRGITDKGGNPITEARLRPHMTEDEVERIDLQGAFALDQAFSAHRLGTKVYEMYDVDPKAPDAGKRLLLAFGFTLDEIQRASDVVCGRGTVEGAPYLKPEHLPIFDCANVSGQGSRFIRPMGHVEMLAAIQPFFSMGMSKTVNMPASATVDDIKHVYFQAWKLGIKSVALYRDGSKGSQPLTSKAAAPEASTAPAEVRVVRRVEREELPSMRAGYTQKVRIDDMKFYLHTGFYPDGRLGEVFIDVSKEGSLVNGIFGALASAVSIGLQYGVPLEVFVDRFTFTRFEPHGVVEGDGRIKMATSPLDYLFRHLAVHVLHRDELAHVPATPGALPVVPVVSAAAPAGTWQAAGPTFPPTEARTVQEPAGRHRLDAQSMEGPACTTCGNTTQRKGTCYTCPVCGTQTGCS